MKSIGSTRSGGSDERGQTTQDFAIGISIFLLTVGFTFGFLPSLLTPFGSTMGDDITAKSDRVAATIIADTHVDGEPRTLDYAELGQLLDENDTEDELRGYFGLRLSADVNVTVLNVYANGTRETVVGPSGANMSAGEEYASQTPAASTTRVVVLTGDRCAVQCLVIVRVW
jgi:YD repeat-containing protein